VLKLHPSLAPVKAVVCPLVKKDGLPEIARKIADDLKSNFKVLYDQAGSIGKRYYRQDEMGTPYCITVDHQTSEDQTVTLRDRDSQAQDRIGLDKLSEVLTTKIDSYRT
jgi:glycyl-tRNA synthetase